MDIYSQWNVVKSIVYSKATYCQISDLKKLQRESMEAVDYKKIIVPKGIKIKYIHLEKSFAFSTGSFKIFWSEFDYYYYYYYDS